MSDYGLQLNNLGIQLQNFGMQIKNLGMQMPFLMQNIIMQMQNISINIINISTQIINIGMNLSNNFNMYFQMNNDIMEKMKMINNNFNEDKQLISIIFCNGTTGEKISITTSTDKTMEELLNLYINKKGLKSNYLEDNNFLYNGYKIDPKEKKTILNYGLKHKDFINISERNF